MNQLIRNVRYLMAGDRQVPFAEKVGVHQTTIGRLLAGKVSPGLDTVQAIAAKFSVSLDDLVYRDLASGERTPPSQPAKLDEVRLGLALTSFDKALSDMEVQGQLGTLVEPLLFAYSKAFKVKDPDAPEDRELYDELVESELRGWKDGRKRSIEAGAAKNRQAAAQSKKTRDRG